MRTSAKICALVAAATFGAAAGAEGVVIHRMSQSGDRVAVTLSTELAPLEEVVRREAPGAVERATRGSRVRGACLKTRGSPPRAAQRATGAR